MCKREIFWMKNKKDTGIRYWVIRTVEKEPRYIETISRWNKQTDYSLVYNVNYGKVWKRYLPPYESAKEFEERTGIKACFQEVDEEAFNHYKSYEEYFNGYRKLTREEKIKLKKEQRKWKQEIYPWENRK